MEKELEEARTEIEQLRRRCENLEKEKEALIHSHSLIEAFLPRATAMAEIIFSKSETTSLETTKHVAQIRDTSHRMGDAIGQSLKQMLEGDDNLHDYVDDLIDQTRSLVETDESFRAMEKMMATDMNQTRQAFAEVVDFSDMIADLAERTNVLAINASIEAARVGNAGRGFAVIAGEVQKLSRNTYDISEKIKHITKEINASMEQTFSSQEKRVSDALTSLDGVRSELESVSSHLHDQVHDVGESIEKSEELSRTVIDQINSITVVLQNQDITRQVLEHILVLLSGCLEKGVPLITKENEDRLTEEIQEMARGVLSVDEEFTAMGMRQHKKSVGRRQNDLQGDIELF